MSRASTGDFWRPGYRIDHGSTTWPTLAAVAHAIGDGIGNGQACPSAHIRILADAVDRFRSLHTDPDAQEVPRRSRMAGRDGNVAPRR